MTKSKNILRATLVLAACAVAVFQLPITAVTLESHAGSLMSGVLGKVDEDVVILYRPQPYSVNLEDVARIIPDHPSEGSRATDEPALVRDLNRLIDHKKAAFRPFQHKARTLLTQLNYKSLEALAIDARVNTTRTATGEWLLSAFYESFSNDLNKRDVPAHERRRKQIQRWLTAHPKSSHALTAMLHATIKLAWAHRGSSSNSKVAQKDRSAFSQLWAEAHGIGAELARRDDLDGEMLYRLAIVAASIEPRHADDALSVLALAARAAKVHPDYPRGFLGAVRKTLPRWGGSVGEMKLLFQTIMTNLPAERRAETYYRLANFLLVEFGSREYVKYDLDWEIIRSGYEDLSRRWPDFDLHRHQFAALAYLHGKPQRVQELLGAVHPGWNYVAESVWQHPEALQEVRDWSARGQEPAEHAENRSDLIHGLRAIGESDLTGLMMYLARGGAVDAQDEMGLSLLHHAIKKNSPALVYALLVGGADIQKANSNGWQAMHYAAADGNSTLLDMLERAGASVDAPNKLGDTPLNRAANKSNRKALRWFLQRAPHTVNTAGERGYTPLLHVAYDGHDDMVQDLLGIDGIDLNAITNFGETALHQAARRGNEAIVRLLLVAGADPHILSKRGDTLLAVAMKSGNRSLVSFLREQGFSAGDAVAGAEPDGSFERSRLLQLEAAALYNDGKWPEAIALYQRAIDAYPTSKNAHVGMAISLFMNKESRLALDSIETAMSIDPEDPELYYKAGRFAFTLGDRDLYMRYFARYAKMAPNTYNTKDLLERLPELASVGAS